MNELLEKILELKSTLKDYEGYLAKAKAIIESIDNNDHIGEFQIFNQDEELFLIKDPLIIRDMSIIIHEGLSKKIAEISLFFENLNINKEELEILYDKYMISNRARKRNYGAKKLRD
jgi:hypothetical protein